MDIIKIKGLDEVIYYDITENGLPIYLWVNNKVSSYHASLNIHYGSVHTNFKVNNNSYKVPSGIAHFLEHIKFNENKNRTAFDYYHENNVSPNASTTFDYTNYLIWGNDNINKNINHLLDFVYNPYFTEEIVSNEKGIIIEEANMTMDDPYTILNFKVLENLLNEYPYRNYICGNVEDIKSINLEDIKLIYNNFYHPKNMFLVVTGNFNPEELMVSIKENMHNKTFNPYNKPKYIFGKETNNVTKELEIIETDISIPKIGIGIKMPLKKFKIKDKFLIKLITRLILDINFGDTSDFKEYLLENNLALNIDFDCYIAVDYLVIIIDSETKYPRELLEKIKNKLKSLSITESELKRKINVLISTLIMQFDDITNVNRNIQENLIYDGYLHDSDKETLDNLTFDKAKLVFNSLNMNNMASIIMESKEKLK